MKKYCIISVLFIFSLGCKKQFEAPVPEIKWSAFDSAIAVPLSYNTRQKIEGIYSFTDGADGFGDFSALKWSYLINNTDTTFYLSIFCEKQIAYFICQGKRVDTNILLNGYWRKMTNTETGRVRFTISQKNGAKHLLSARPFNMNTDSILISGAYGNGNDIPDQKITFKYKRPLYNAKPFDILADRGGGRTSDLLPASENSVEIIKMASRFGGTGIEIDIRVSSDGVPLLFHDLTLNERIIQKNGLLGPIENYTFAQLNALVRLEQGEHIPSLREVLNTVVYNTPLNYVWLDVKYNSSLQAVRDLQKEFTQKALAIGRKVDIVIGIPDQATLTNFLALKDYKESLSLCEMSLEDVRNVSAHYWAPRWTLGLQNEMVDQMHTEGRKAIVWTLNVPGNVLEFMNQGRFDGILSNYPSIVAYYYYARQ